MIACAVCFGNELEEHLWIDTLTGEITDRNNEYYCRSCECMTSIIETANPEIWVEDVEPLTEEDEQNLIDAPTKPRVISDDD